jgi:hypothetical protein
MIKNPLTLIVQAKKTGYCQVRRVINEWVVVTHTKIGSVTQDFVEVIYHNAPKEQDFTIKAVVYNPVDSVVIKEHHIMADRAFKIIDSIFRDFEEP